MTNRAAVKRDFLAGLLVLIFGLFFAGFGTQYTIGTPGRMGPGFFPVALGSLLGLLGIVIAATALAGSPDEFDDVLPSRPDWRGWGCIAAGIVAFIVFGEYAGLFPAIFGCVFISALGDREATLRGSLLLAAGMASFGTALFVYGLQTSFPAFRF